MVGDQLERMSEQVSVEMLELRVVLLHFVKGTGGIPNTSVWETMTKHNTNAVC